MHSRHRTKVLGEGPAVLFERLQGTEVVRARSAVARTFSIRPKAKKTENEAWCRFMFHFMLAYASLPDQGVVLKPVLAKAAWELIQDWLLISRFLSVKNRQVPLPDSF